MSYGLEKSRSGEVRETYHSVAGQDEDDGEGCVYQVDVLAACIT